MSEQIEVRVTRTMAVDVEAFVELAKELLEFLDENGVMVIDRVPSSVIPDEDPDWTWSDVIRVWAKARAERGA